MDWIVAIVVVSTGGWLINNWIRAKHGYALENEWGGKTEPTQSKEAEVLRAENAELHSKLDTMQDRMVVLEKIVTDRGYSLSDEIDALRDVPAKSADSGVPLDMNTQTKA